MKRLLNAALRPFKALRQRFEHWRHREVTPKPAPAWLERAWDVLFWVVLAVAVTGILSGRR